MVVGITNALNVVADGLPADLLPPPEVGEPAASLLAELAGFHGGEAPAPFRLLAGDPAYLGELAAAWRHAFTDRRLGRRLKTALAFAVSLTTRSAFGSRFHLAELRRLGVGERGVMEVVGVTQMFSSYTKIADTLALESDMGDIAPVDPTPPPGG
ncbi:MAG TPA: carboxymuconolactone decarboxylase family protein [Candidatus Binatia bacterium]|nr:carboxymuconolactone decarboxylase family protein [Candidatus Binatia bacterium]